MSLKSQACIVTHMNTTPTTTAASLQPMAGSTIVKALEDAYAAVRANHPDLPEVVFITGTGLMGRGAKWGHYGHGRWVKGSAGLVDAETGRIPEVFIAGERLACGARDTFQTLVHESVHALAAIREVKDVSRDFRYHNRKFVALAEELGMEFPADAQPHPAIGFSAVVLTEETVEAYADVIAALEASIAAHLDTFKGMDLSGKGAATAADPDPSKARGTKAKAPSRSNLKASCGCGRIVRMSRKVMDEGSISCGKCGEDFQEVGE